MITFAPWVFSGSLRVALSARFLVFVIVALFAPALHADSTATHERTVTQVADGVYVIRHPDAPDGFPQGNTTVVIGADAVLPAVRRP
jgi:hypothetical protein